MLVLMAEFRLVETALLHAYLERKEFPEVILVLTLVTLAPALIIGLRLQPIYRGRHDIHFLALIAMGKSADIVFPIVCSSSLDSRLLIHLWRAVETIKQKEEKTILRPPQFKIQTDRFFICMSISEKPSCRKFTRPV